MAPRITTLTLALLLPSAAMALPMEPQGVYEMEGVEQAKTLASAHEKEKSYKAAIERRKAAWERAEMAIDDARAERKLALERREEARDRVEKAVESGHDVEAAIRHLAAADRAVMEARDFVKLQKTREHAAEERHDREIARYDLAVAQRKLLEEQIEDGFDDEPKRLMRKVAKAEEALRDDHRRYELALAHVRERRQDYYNPIVYRTFTFALPMDDTDSMEGGDNQSAMNTNEEPATVSDLRRVHFDLGESTLDTEALNNLAWNAHVLRENPEVTVQIEGHTDLTGPMALNRELAWDRAEAVEEFLLSQGVYEDQVETVGYGETRPLVVTKNATEVNRRTELRVISNPDGMVDSSLDNPLQDWNGDLDE